MPANEQNGEQLHFTTKGRLISPYEIYSPIVAILVAAEKATALPRLGNPNMKLRVHASHTDN
jgi:hypothetical protein